MASASLRKEVAVVVYSRPGCTYCAKAKALLAARGVDFGIVDVAAEPSRRAEAEELSGAKTVPQIFVGRRLIGGFDDLKALDVRGKLLEALARRSEDGEGPAPTPEETLLAASAFPAAIRERLAPRAEALKKLKYRAGSRPSIRSLLRYGLTSTVRQDQKNNVVLNLAAPPGSTAPELLSDLDASALAALLRSAMLQLLEEFVDPASGDVDYLRMRDSERWGLFRAVAAELGAPRLQAELTAMDENDRKAFFINLYNSMAFHGVVAYGRPPGYWGLYCFFITPAVSYRLAGVQVSLDDVEHGFLRADPGHFQEPFQALQRQLRMSEVDPRIHMALNCASKGCPPVGTYSSGPALDAELDSAVSSFLASDANLRVEVAGAGQPLRLSLSSLFQMYLKDFAGPGAKEGSAETNRALVRWIVSFAQGPRRDLLTAALADGAPAPQISWIPYDWEMNGSKVPPDEWIYSPVF